MKRLCIIALTAVSVFQLAAQSQLNKEIIIEREITPELSAASRINNYPTVILPTINPTTLTFSDLTTSAPVTTMLTTLEPADMGNAVSVMKQKGYASFGYFPSFNVGASAGYRIINKPRTSLGLWLQYDGNGYNATGIGDDTKRKFERNSLTVGADFTKIFKRAGRLDISADFSYHSLNRPWQEWSDSIYKATAFNAQAVWSARKYDMLYFVRGKINHFGFNNTEHCLYDPEFDDLFPAIPEGKLSQNIFSLDGGTSYLITPNSSLAGLISFDFVHYNHYNRYFYDDLLGIGNIPMIVGGQSRTLGLITIAPSYRYHNGIFSANLGLKAQISTNAGKTFHIAPDVDINLSPSSIFSIQLNVGGGEYINRLANLFEINPYMSPSIAYSFSHRPIDTELHLKFGPFKGVGFEIFGGYDKANEWMAATLVPGSEGLVTFTPTNLSAWNFGISADAKVSSWMTAKAKYTRTPGSYDKASLRNPDRAKHVVEASVEFKPLDALKINVGYEFRGTRALYTFADDTTDPMRISLRNSNTFNLGASYEITKNISVLATVENLFGNRAYEVWGFQRQGIKGLIGVAVKF